MFSSYYHLKYCRSKNVVLMVLYCFMLLVKWCMPANSKAHSIIVKDAGHNMPLESPLNVSA